MSMNKETTETSGIIWIHFPLWETIAVHSSCSTYLITDNTYTDPLKYLKSKELQAFEISLMIGLEHRISAPDYSRRKKELNPSTSRQTNRHGNPCPAYQPDKLISKITGDQTQPATDRTKPPATDKPFLIRDGPLPTRPLSFPAYHR
ncbi:MAG: hypothetical protein LBD78_08055 [Spirochaetaceae bacterium]|jgi:hypothetical protein|nr:hypothetical protein [Spirochaetaceae bacterium]